MVERPILRLAFLATLLFLAAPLVQGCGGCSRGGDGASDDDDDDDAVTAPVITAVIPAQGKQGTVVEVVGQYFGATQADSTVVIGGVPVTPSSWSDTSLTLTVPAAVAPGDAPVVVTARGLASNDGPFRVVLSFAVYAHNDNGPLSVSAFAVSTDGALTELPGSPYITTGNSAGFGGDNSALAVHAGRRLLFASTDTKLAVFSIDGATGALTEVAGSPFPTGTTQNYGVAVSPDGSFVYVVSYANNAVAGFAVGSNGALNALPGSPFGGRPDGFPDGIAMHRDGGWLLVNQEGTQTLDVWSVETDGSILLVSTDLQHPVNARDVFALEMHPTRDHLYTGGRAPGFTGYAFDPVDGSLTTLPGAPWLAADAGSPTITPDGNILYLGQNLDGVIHGYAIADDGSLMPLAGFPLDTGFTSGLILDVDAEGRFLFAADEGASRLNVFSIGVTGNLLLVSSAGLPANGDVSEIVVTP